MNLLSAWKERRQIKRVERQHRIEQEEQARWQRAIDARLHYTDDELRAEIDSCNKTIERLDFNYRVRKLAGRTGRMAPIYHCESKSAFYYAIHVCESILTSRNALHLFE